MENLNETPNLSPEQPKNSPKLKYLLIGGGVVLLGIIALLLAQSNFFKGQLIVQSPVDRADSSMKEIEDYVTPVRSAKDPLFKQFVNWPVESNKESSFRVEEDVPHFEKVIFSHEAAYGRLRMIYADFELIKSGNYIKVKDKSESENVDVYSRCATLYKSEQEKVEECFGDGDENVGFDISQYPEGEYEVKLIVKDKEGRFDDAVKTFTVDPKPEPVAPEPVIVPELEIECSATLQENKKTVQFINNSVYSPNEDEEEWEWTWTVGYKGQDGKDVTVEGKAPTHDYPVKDVNETYKISLKGKYKNSDYEQNKGCGEIEIPKPLPVAVPDPVVITPKFSFNSTGDDENGINYELYNESIIANGELTSVVWGFAGAVAEQIELKADALIDLNNDGIKGDFKHNFPYKELGNGGDYGPENRNVALRAYSGEVFVKTAQDIPVEKYLKTGFSCHPAGGQTRTFRDASKYKGENVPNNSKLEIKFADGSSNIEIGLNDLAAKLITINDHGSPFTYTVTHPNGIKDTITTTINDYCPNPAVPAVPGPVGGYDFIPKPKIPVVIPDYVDFQAFGGMNVFNYLATNAFEPDVDTKLWTKLQAKPGAKVYFQTSCKTGEKKFAIEPKPGLKVYLDVAKNSSSCIAEAKPAPTPKSQCSDELDNDEDTLVDFPADPGCESAEDDDETDTPPPVEDPPVAPKQCSDTLDNDNDGKIDHPEDPGCESAEDDDEADAVVIPPAVLKQCSDTLDNDGDGKIDHPLDPGCDSPDDDNETDTPVTVVTTTTNSGPQPQCSDGQDNDDDGYIDFGKDPGCDSPQDNNEFNKIAKSVTQCSDGEDNDNDGFEDLEDPGCEDANDNNEKNQEETIKKGATKLPLCLKYVSPKTFVDFDFENEELEDVITDQSSIAYDGKYEEFEGKAIFVGYTKEGKRYFKGDQPIRRDEVVKILQISTCYPDYLLSKKKFSEKKVGFNDPEFKNSGYWAKEFIFIAANGGIVDKNKTKFNPGKNVTRAEFLKMLMTMYSETTGKKIAECKTEKTVFVDVQKGDWFCKYAKMANDMDIAEGYKDKNGKLRLNPNHILTRTDAAALIHNYFVKLAGEDYAGDLKDVDEDEEDED